MKSKLLSSILAVLLFGSVLFQVKIHNISLYLLVLWFISSCFDYRQEMPIILGQRKYKYLLLFFIFYFFSTTIATTPYYGFVRTLYQFSIFAPLLMFDLIEYNDRSTKMFLFLMSTIVFVAYAVYMFGFIKVYGTDLGIKSSVWHIHDETFVANSFYYVYSLPIVIASLVFLSRYSIRQKRKFFLICFGVLLATFFSTLVAMSLFMTATVILFISIIASLLINLQTGKWIQKTSIAIALTMMLFVGYHPSVANKASEIGSTQFDQRITEIYDVLTGNSQQAEDFSSRQDLFFTSLQTFFRHPLFGVNHIMSGRVDELVIGNHAEWVDLLGEYGVFAILILLALWDSVKKLLEDPSLAIPVFIYILTGFLNPMMHIINNYTLFVFIPLLFDFYHNKVEQLSDDILLQ